MFDIVHSVGSWYRGQLCLGPYFVWLLYEPLGMVVRQLYTWLDQRTPKPLILNLQNNLIRLPIFHYFITELVLHGSGEIMAIFVQYFRFDSYQVTLTMPKDPNRNNQIFESYWQISPIEQQKKLRDIFWEQEQ